VIPDCTAALRRFIVHRSETPGQQLARGTLLEHLMKLKRCAN
jgi:hypothetical protein